MKKITFVHTADWHIRDTQYGRRFRGEDFAKAIRQAVQIAIDNKVDFIINGGDTFHVKGPSGFMMDLLFEVHVMLKRASIPMYTVTGNHDNTEPSYLGFPGYEDRDLPCGPGGVVCIDNQIIEHGGIRIAGYPAIEWSELMKIVAEFPKLAKPVDIVVWHGAIQEFVGFPMPHAGKLEEIPAGVAKAWLLGDIHLRAAKRLPDSTLVSYPGTVELVERGEPARKFVDIYTLEDGWRAKPFPDPMPIELDTRPVVFLQVNDDAQADSALLKIKAAVDASPDFPPMVFMRYAKSMKSIVRRVMELIDLRTTVFRAGMITTAFDKGLVGGTKTNVRPEILESVAAVVPVGTPVYTIACELCNPLVNHRQILNEWVDKQLAVGLAPLPEGFNAAATAQQQAIESI
jgi:DNA repair exonuclease SbcCD nuclease subunit